MKWQSAERCANDDWLKPLKKIQKNPINLSAQWLIYWMSLTWKVALTFIKCLLACAVIQGCFHASDSPHPHAADALITSSRYMSVECSFMRQLLQFVNQMRARGGHTLLAPPRLCPCRSMAVNWQAFFKMFRPRSFTLSYCAISMLLLIINYAAIRKKVWEKDSNEVPPPPKKSFFAMVTKLFVLLFWALGI